MGIMRGRRWGGDEEDRGRQIHDDGRRLKFGWWAHNVICRWRILELYTWNSYNAINQCHPNTSNIREGMITSSQVRGPDGTICHTQCIVDSTGNWGGHSCLLIGFIQRDHKLLIFLSWREVALRLGVRLPPSHKKLGDRDAIFLDYISRRGCNTKSTEKLALVSSITNCRPLSNLFNLCFLVSNMWGTIVPIPYHCGEDRCAHVWRGLRTVPGTQQEQNKYELFSVFWKERLAYAKAWGRKYLWQIN